MTDRTVAEHSVGEDIVKTLRMVADKLKRIGLAATAESRGLQLKVASGQVIEIVIVLSHSSQKVRELFFREADFDSLPFSLPSLLIVNPYRLHH